MRFSIYSPTIAKGKYQKMIKNIKKNLFILIDYFYFIFDRFVPIQTYRYAICGGSNVLFDLTLYFIFFHFVFEKQNFDLIIIVLSPHIASLFIVYPITFCTGFLLNRHIVFHNSKLPLWTQFFRYLFVGITALIISYVLMKILVERLSVYPTPSRFITIVITVLYGYIMQTKFSFKIDD